jgi:hypothetical protein
MASSTYDRLFPMYELIYQNLYVNSDDIRTNNNSKVLFAMEVNRIISRSIILDPVA